MKMTQRSSFALAVGLGAFALIGGTGLTISSAWLITMASQHPPVLVLSVAIVMGRFFGIFRSVARYGERVISHEAIFRKLTGSCGTKVKRIAPISADGTNHEDRNRL
jgi:ABC-type transport system involved in cytochrome bd biosynthesis fused ATPase/permease subunit